MSKNNFSIFYKANIALIILVLVLNIFLNIHIIKSYSVKNYELQAKILRIAFNNGDTLNTPNVKSNIIKNDLTETYLNGLGFNKESFYNSSIMRSLRHKVVIVNVVTFALLSILFTFLMVLKEKRNKAQLEMVNYYLMEISSGNLSLDIRDNDEGDFSLLKNNIYKIIQKLKNSNNQLNHQKLQLNNAISDISHQLKTPLTSLQLMTDLLSRDDLDSAKKDEFINNMQLTLKRFNWLITTLLKLAKFDANTVDFKIEKVRILKLINRVIEALSIPIELKELKIRINGDPEASFKGDLDWSIEALNNIIKNCIEHSKQKGLLKVEFDENSLYSEILIQDFGLGIDTSDLPNIFTRFYKGKNASSDSVGIGLALSKSIIEKQNGEIRVSSELNQGTIFIIRFYKNII